MTIYETYFARCQEPSDINEHLPLLRSLAAECEHVTEMGVRAVVSTWAMLAAMPRAIRCYDLHYHPNIKLAQEAACAVGIDFQFILADTTCTSISCTDMLFIDTLHTADQLRKELALHAGLVGKYLVFHDTTTFGVNGELPGSSGLWIAIEEFLEYHPEWRIHLRHHHNNGLTVLTK